MVKGKIAAGLLALVLAGTSCAEEGFEEVTSVEPSGALDEDINVEKAAPIVQSQDILPAENTEGGLPPSLYKGVAIQVFSIQRCQPCFCGYNGGVEVDINVDDDNLADVPRKILEDLLGFKDDRHVDALITSWGAGSVKTADLPHQYRKIIYEDALKKMFKEEDDVIEFKMQVLSPVSDFPYGNHEERFELVRKDFEERLREKGILTGEYDPARAKIVYKEGFMNYITRPGGNRFMLEFHGTYERDN